MSAKPSIVVVSSSNTKPASIIRLITGCKSPLSDPSDPQKCSVPWTLETKYYKADVDMIGISENYERTPQFNNNIEALIIHMDTNKESGLEDISKWGPIEIDSKPDVKLLLTNYCTDDTKITNSKAMEWCLRHGFELIELYPAKIDEEEDEVIKEKVGVERVIEALEAHTWSNLILKSQVNGKEEKNQRLAGFCEDFLIGDENDDFQNLFSQLSVMKESLQSLPAGQRKQCAEQVVTAFWKAIDGDEEEIEDLDI